MSPTTHTSIEETNDMTTNSNPTAPAPSTPTTPASAPAPVPAAPPATRQSLRSLWAVVLLLCVADAAYVLYEHPALTAPLGTVGTVAVAVGGAVKWVRQQ